MTAFKFSTITIGFSIALMSFFLSCDNEDGPDTPWIIDNTYKQVKLTPISGLRVAWDYSSLQRLAEEGSHPVVIRVSADSLFAIYEYQQSIYGVISNDNGVSWGSPFTLFEKTSHQGTHDEHTITFDNLMTQPTAIKLSNGDIVIACGVTFSYTVETVVTEFPAAILTRRIASNGTLEPILEAYRNFGCESPSFLELPNGDLQLYFSNGTVAQTLDVISSTGLLATIGEQKIDMIQSHDRGATWSSYIGEFGPDGIEKRWTGSKTIAFRSDKINRSPSASILDDKIILAYADNRNVTFKPYVIRTPVVNNWPYPINGDSPDREYALYEILPNKYFMGEPSLLVLPTGESLLAYETDANRNKTCETLEVAISDKESLNFTKTNRPLDFMLDIRAINNSLMLFDDNIILASMTSNLGSSPNNAPWLIKGHVMNDLSITDATITDYPLFIGGLSDANVMIGLGVDNSNLYVEAKAVDNTPVYASTDSQEGDGIYIYIDAANLSLLDVDKGIYKFWISTEGDIKRWDGKEGEWNPATSSGITANATKDESGYTLSITISKASLTNFNNDHIRFGAALSNYTESSKGSVELLSLCKDLRSSSWLGVSL